MLERIKGWFTRAGVETANLNDPAAVAALWDMGATASTGETITKHRALEYPPLLQAVSLISGDVARFPLEVFRRLDRESARERDRSHPGYRVAARLPNPEVTPFTFWRRFMVSLLLYGRAYAYVERSVSGELLGLYNLLPDRTYAQRVRIKGQRNPQLVYATEVDGQLVPLPPAEVLHVEGICTDNIDGCDVVQRAREAIAVGLAQQGFQATFFKNGASAGGVLEVPANFTKRAKDTLEQGFAKKYSGKDNWFKTVILRDGAKFHRQTFSLSEIENTEAQDANARQIARIYNLSPSKLGLSDSVSYNSKAEDNQAYLDSTLAPYLVAIAQECDRKLLRPVELERDTHFFEHNTYALLRLNPVERAKLYAIGIRNAWLYPDEVRDFENLPPREPAETPNPDTGGANDGQFDNDRARAVYSIGIRARHKAETSPAAFLEWLDTDLKYHREECRKLGVNPAIVDPIIRALQEVANTATPDRLVARVNEVMSNAERTTALCPGNTAA